VSEPAVASIEKRETSRGPRYDVRYREPGGKARVKTWRRRADAERFARQIEVDKDRGLFIDPALARTTLAEVAARWLASNPGKRDGSWQRDEIVVRLHIVPDLGSRPVGSLTPADVQDLVNTWATKHAPGSVRREYGVLRAILNYALANDMIGRSPCRRIKLPAVTPVRRHIIDGNELGRLAAAMGGVEGYGTMAYLGTLDGLRWGEVAGLHVGQLDFEARTVRITQTVVRGRRGAIGLGEPKSDAGRRTLAVPLALVEMVGKHMTARGLTVDDRDALLFTAPEGGMLRYSNWLRRIWYPATIAAGLGTLVEDEATGRRRYLGLGFHDLRRANATGLVAEGVDIKTAQAMLGHSNVQLTVGLYAQAVVSLGAAAAESMASRFLLPGSAPRDGRAMEPAESGEDGPVVRDAAP
jgi:integrase